ncbi:MAG: hypothetical protein K9I47_10500 [Bacteroidales bacterium]|nr:hypothetical protein [Bacteroidales bacterium]
MSQPPFYLSTLPVLFRWRRYSHGGRSQAMSCRSAVLLRGAAVLSLTTTGVKHSPYVDPDAYNPPWSFDEFIAWYR